MYRGEARPILDLLEWYMREISGGMNPQWTKFVDSFYSFIFENETGVFTW
jgi:hypothetical protein